MREEDSSSVASASSSSAGSNGNSIDTASVIEDGNSNKDENEANLPPEPPGRPMTEYHCFFQLERAYLLQTMDDDATTGDDATANNNAGSPSRYSNPNDEPFPRPSKYQNIHLPPNWYSNQSHPLHTPKPKRSHKKSHGKISFLTLTKTISANWNSVDYETRQYCRDLAEGELRLYNQRMRGYVERWGEEAMRGWKRRKSELKKSRGGKKNKSKAVVVEVVPKKEAIRDIALHRDTKDDAQVVKNSVQQGVNPSIQDHPRQQQGFDERQMHMAYMQHQMSVLQMQHRNRQMQFEQHQMQDCQTMHNQGCMMVKQPQDCAMTKQPQDDQMMQFENPILDCQMMQMQLQKQEHTMRSQRNQMMQMQYQGQRDVHHSYNGGYGYQHQDNAGTNFSQPPLPQCNQNNTQPHYQHECPPLASPNNGMFVIDEHREYNNFSPFKCFSPAASSEAGDVDYFEFPPSGLEAVLAFDEASVVDATAAAAAPPKIPSPSISPVPNYKIDPSVTFLAKNFVNEFAKYLDCDHEVQHEQQQGANNDEELDSLTKDAIDESLYGANHDLKTSSRNTKKSSDSYPELPPVKKAQAKHYEGWDTPDATRKSAFEGFKSPPVKNNNGMKQYESQRYPVKHHHQYPMQPFAHFNQRQYQHQQEATMGNDDPFDASFVDNMVAGV